MIKNGSSPSLKSAAGAARAAECHGRAANADPDQLWPIIAECARV
jgi:hypothetical protein